MKYLDLETCKYLLFLGCESHSHHWHVSYMNLGKLEYGIYSNDTAMSALENGWEFERIVHAFSLEDLLRESNMIKIAGIGYRSTKDVTESIVRCFQSHPDTWPEEVKKIIKPSK